MRGGQASSKPKTLDLLHCAAQVGLEVVRTQKVGDTDEVELCKMLRVEVCKVEAHATLVIRRHEFRQNLQRRCVNLIDVAHVHDHRFGGAATGRVGRVAFLRTIQLKATETLFQLTSIGKRE